MVIGKRGRYQNRIELLQGTLDLLILQTLHRGPQHGYGLAQAIQSGSSDVLQVDTGSLYPALHRLERKKWIAATWKLSAEQPADACLSVDGGGPAPARRRALALGAARGCDYRRARPAGGIADEEPRRRPARRNQGPPRNGGRGSRESGGGPRAAAAGARRELGNVGLIQEVVRDTWGRRWIERSIQDVRYALRVFRRNPGFALVAILSLTLGIGANAALFQVVNALRLRALPVADPARLAEIRLVDMDGARGNFQTWNAAVTYPIWQAIAARQQAFSGSSPGATTRSRCPPTARCEPLVVSGSQETCFRSWDCSRRWAGC